MRRNDGITLDEAWGLAKLLMWVIGMMGWIMAIGSAVSVVLYALTATSFNRFTALLLIVGGAAVGFICFAIVGRKPVVPYWWTR